MSSLVCWPASHLQASPGRRMLTQSRLTFHPLWSILKHIVFLDGRHNSALMGKPVRRMEMKCTNVFWLGGRKGARELNEEGKEQKTKKWRSTDKYDKDLGNGGSMAGDKKQVGILIYVEWETEMTDTSWGVIKTRMPESVVCWDNWAANFTVWFLESLLSRYAVVLEEHLPATGWLRSEMFSFTL